MTSIICTQKHLTDIKASCSLQYIGCDVFSCIQRHEELYNMLYMRQGENAETLLHCHKCARHVCRIVNVDYILSLKSIYGSKQQFSLFLVLL